MSTVTYFVAGMTCGHCVNAVTTEVSGIAGVDRAEVSLADGSLRVTAAEQPTEAAIAAAVAEAGYALAACS